ncbi:MAG: replicative DNA helicase [Candidatus Pacebacteria bacterium]|nr:replicative DNA helicase [Candidatus Paceibacterota bacterium]
MPDDRSATPSVSLLRGDRPLPHNTEAEVAVLGSVLLDPAVALDAAASALNFSGSFYHPAHQEIFQTLLRLANNSKGARGAIDVVTLSDALEKRQKLEDVGGRAYLTQLLNSVPTAANVEYYVDIVHQNAILRRLIRSSTETLEKCFEPHDSVRTLIDEIESEILTITGLKQGRDMVAVGDMIFGAIEHIEKLHQKDPLIMGLQTGFAGLDDIILGLRAGEMFVLAARPSIGKTALALNMAENIAMRSDGVPVGIFSLEMSTKQLVLRLLCSLARISLADIRDCALSQGRWQEIMRAGDRLRKAPIYIDDTSANLDIVELRARARRMKREHDIQVLFIDYLQLLKPVNANKNTTRENEVSQISGGIKSLAKELDIPIVVLAQLNRQAEQAGQRPKLSHLRESGAIEQDADVVALLHRERDVESSTPIDPRTGMESELVVAKHRNGRTGVASLLFIPAYTRFENRSAIPDEDVPATE